MKRVSKTRLFVLLLLLSVGGGCTQSFVEEDDIPPHALKDVDAGFTLKVLATRTPVTRSITFTPEGTIESDTLAVGVKDSVQTKAAAPLTEEQENQIASLWVGQYDATTGARLFNQYIPSMTGTTVNLKLKQSQNDSKSHVYFIPNAGDLGAIADETTLKKHTLAYVSSDGAGLPDGNLCHMVGMWEGVVKEGGAKDISVELTRLVAKITFTYSMGADFTFRPTEVKLKNAPTVSQVEAPSGQLSGITYEDYTGTASGDGGTIYWYLPENMAGTVSDGNAVDSEKKKTGKGVTNATYIVLTGDAVQGGVTYKNVSFTFYPGSDKNNYDIIRNSHYTMTVKLVGIDVSDERITVGEIPPIVVDPTEMPAKKGGEKEIQITARPGQPWKFDMPSWLSAKLDEDSISSGATITHQGPANVKFIAVEANPKAEKRSVSFKIDVNGTNQDITITQSGATLTKGNDVSLTATKGSEGESSFTATKGLQWLVALSGDGWLGWSGTNPGTSGDEAPEEAQALKVQATSVNPSAQARSGKITVKAGASVGDAAYTALKKEINVTQAGSTVTGSEINIAAEGVNSQTSSFTATAGLAWAADVTSGNWITCTGATSGNPTTGSVQDITFKAEVNPSSSQRSGEITVRAGDTGTGPTGKITVTQNASSLTAGDPVTLAATKDATGSLKITGTSGLPLTITPPSWVEITTNPVPTETAGSEQTVEYKTKEVNLNSTERVAENISVKAGDITQTVAIKQSGSIFSVSETELSFEKAGGSGTVEVEGTAGLPWTVSPSVATNGITPDIASSDADGTKQTLTFSATENTGGARSATFTIAVTGGDHSKTVEVKQAGESENAVTIDQAMADAYKKAQSNLTAYPPFNYDGGTVSGTTGSDYKGVSSTATISTPYTIEVEKTQSSSTYRYDTSLAKNYCTSLGAGWRLPTQIELFAMWTKCKGTNTNAADDEAESTALGAKFISGYYWSSSVCNGNSNYRCILYFSNGSFLGSNAGNTRYVRCVRDI
ncbi:MAG: BACON domain-containing protein [Parabacteroides gordonii]|uniref:BACON domain-containing protein n=1 Tax=Parabacteroides gordonii TaxID=574930 RepID=UPI003A8997D1